MVTSVQNTQNLRRDLKPNYGAIFGIILTKEQNYIALVYFVFSVHLLLLFGHYPAIMTLKRR